MGPPRKKKRVQEPAQTEGRSPRQTKSMYRRPTTVQQNSHLLETPHNTESQTGPSQQIDYNRLAREIVNLQNSQNISATGNNHSDHFQQVDFSPNQHTDEDQFCVQSQQVQNQSVHNVSLIQNQDST